MGLPQLLNRSIHRRQLAILMYHGIVKTPLSFSDWCFLDEPAFRDQIAYIKKHFRLLPLSKAIELLKSDAITKPTAVLTFDDGFQNVYDAAFPILQEYEAPATLFLTTELVDSTDTVWFCRLNQALAGTKKSSLAWRGVSYHIAGPAEKSRVSSIIQNQLKKLPPPVMKASLLEIFGHLEAHPARCVEEGSPFQMLRAEAIKRMFNSGLIEVGSHSHSHTSVSLLTPEEQKREIQTSLGIVQELTGRPCESFAYPNGCWNDYNETSLQLLRASGVHCAVTTISGPNYARTPAMELKRYCIGAGMSMVTFQLLVSGAFYRFDG